MNSIKLSVIKRLVPLFMLVLVHTVLSFPKVGVTSFQFLKVVPGARSTGMGEAYSSVTSGSDAMYWNPAALVQVKSVDINLSHVDWFLDTQHYAVSAAYSFNAGVSFGLTAQRFDYGELAVTRVSDLYPTEEGYNPGLTGEIIQPGATIFGIGFGQSLTNKFSYGLNAKYVTEDMQVRSKSLFMFDAGMLYDTKFRSITVSATVRNFGPEVEYYDKSYPLPQTLNVGISAYIVSPADNLLLINPNHSLLFAFDIIQPRDYDQQYAIGMEYSLLNSFFIRGGYKINFDTAGLGFGFGLMYRGFKIDYSYNSYVRYLENVNRFSFVFEL